ncbi:acyltransferase-like protein [Pantoea sp. AG1095]|nr:acyltransferase-like protein [Pantoea sp. AG1095]
MKVFTSKTSFHLWFMPPFIGYAILLPMIKYIFNEDGKDKFRFIICCVFVFSICIPSIISIIGLFIKEQEYLVKLNQFNLTLPGYILYAMAFPYLHKKINIKLGMFVYLITIAFNVLLNVFSSEKIGRPVEIFYGFTTLTVFLSSYIFFNVVMTADLSFLPNFMKWITYEVGECSFGIYLAQRLVYLSLDKLGWLNHDRAIVDPLVNTLVTFAVTLLCVGVFRRIKFLRY